MKNSKWKMENKIQNSLRLYASAFLILALSAIPVLAQKRVKTAAAKPMKSTIATVLQPGKSPIVNFRIQFLTGSIDDPEGKEGIASLTAAMLANGGTKNLTYDQIVAEFYPMASGFGWQSDKEMTTFSGAAHVDNLPKYYEIISQMLLDPGFRDEDFTRLKDEAINFLKTGLRQGNDEELGKERLYNIIYADHPYEHHSMVTISSLEKLTLEDVKNFYRENYSQANLVVGLSGGYDAKFSNQMLNDFAKLPKGARKLRKIGVPQLADGMKIDIVKRETRATAISM